MIEIADTSVFARMVCPSTPGHLLPIQDAGLQTYLRTLDIHFYHSEKKDEAYISLKGASSRRG